MSEFSQQIAILEQNYLQAEELKETIANKEREVEALRKHHTTMVEALQLLSTVSDMNTQTVLDYITSIVNKTLAELFPHDSRRIYLKKQLYKGQYAQITIQLAGTGGRKRDIQLQSGTGLRQVISFLFLLSLLEIRKCRPILLMDEILSGLHPEAKRIVMDIVKIFADEGFQFVMVEYGTDDVGKLYLVEKPGAVATVTPLGEDTYHNQVFVFNRPPEDVDLSIFVDEGADIED
jgi:DNA repair exonuclease SbcCD ATPase subunit